MITNNLNQQGEGIHIYMQLLFIMCAEIVSVHHRSLVTNQDEFDQIVIGNYENAIQSKRWEFKERDTIMNLYRARHSLELSWEIMADYASSQGIKYDAVIALRPDMAFVSDIDIAKLQSMEEDTIYVPSWESNGGINDRFAFGQMEAMRAYMNRNEHIIPLQKKVQ